MHRATRASLRGSEIRKSCREIGRGARPRADIEDIAMQDRINLVKVFSATKARDRDTLGERVTAWLRDNPGIQVLRTVISQTSDNEFHCLSFVLICAAV